MAHSAQFVDEIERKEDEARLSSRRELTSLSLKMSFVNNQRNSSHNNAATGGGTASQQHMRIVDAG